EMDRATAPADLERCDLRRDSSEVVVDAEVEHTNVDTVLCGEHRDARLADQERVDHGGRDGLGVGRDAMVGHAMVAGEYDGADPVDRSGRHLALRRGDPDGQIPEPAESAGRGRETREAF